MKGVDVAPRDVVAAVLPDPSTLGHKAKGDCAIGAVVKGTKNGKKLGYFIYTQLSHEKTYKKYGHSATAYSVGAPLAIAAILFAQGKIKQKGVFPPEMLDPEPFVKMLPEVRHELPREEALGGRDRRDAPSAHKPRTGEAVAASPEPPFSHSTQSARAHELVN